MIVAQIRRLWQHFLDDNLFRNSIYLMLTTGVMGGLGFFFWIICTHIFTPDQIGLGTSLISAMSLISFISLFGFNNTFVRFLPNSQDRNAEINTGSWVVILAAIAASVIYLALLSHITPQLLIIRDNIWFSAGFVIMVALAAINSLTDSIFVAFRAAQYALITDGFVMSISKLLLPFAFVGLGAYGVFAAQGLAASIGMAASVFFLIVKFGYKPSFSIRWDILKRVFHYSFANYISNLFNVIPSLTLPIIVINHLGAPAAAYYFLTFMIINLLYAVSNSVSQSLFAEGSYGGIKLKELLRRSVKILLFIMLPAGILLAVFGPTVLHFFGKSYSDGGSQALIILAIASPAVAAFSIGGVILRIRHQIYSLMATNFVYTAAVNGLTLLWINRGLGWVAVAWMIGNFLAAIVAFAFIYIRRGRPTPAGNLVP